MFAALAFPTKKPCDCGNSASLGPALSPCPVDLCGGRSLCGVAVDLNRVDARHREFLRLREVPTICFPSDLSFARIVDLQDKIGPSLAVPSFTALPISAASCNSCMRLVPTIRSRNHVTQRLDQFNQKNSGPRAALDLRNGPARFPQPAQHRL